MRLRREELEAPQALEVVAGEAQLRTWAPDGGFEKVFCGLCGSALFSRDPAEPSVVSVRLGSFDADPGVRPEVRTFVEFAAPWEPIPDDGLPRFAIGIVIASGPVMAGTIGSAERRELIVVGRPMIAAARIQRMTRLFDAHIIAGEETFNEVKGRVQHRELGTPRLKGIKQRAALYEILAREP